MGFADTAVLIPHQMLKASGLMLQVRTKDWVDEMSFLLSILCCHSFQHSQLMHCRWEACQRWLYSPLTRKANNETPPELINLGFTSRYLVPVFRIKVSFTLFLH